MAAACATTSSSSMRKRSMMSSANCQAGTLARLATVGGVVQSGQSEDCHRIAWGFIYI